MADIPITIPPGLNSDDTTLASAPGWSDASLVRFRNGRPQTVGGWETIATGQSLTGVCRSVLNWTDNANTPLLAFGTHSKLYVWDNNSTFWDVTPYGPVTVLGSNPFATTNGSATVTVTHASHGLSTSNQVIISGAVDTNGIVAANLNGTRTITVVDANSYTFTAGANATSTGSGGGTVVRIVPQVTLPAGSIDGSASAGYGTGAYGGGAYGTSTAGAYYLRTWALAAWGQTLMANPRGGALYQWSNDTSVKAIAVANCPPAINYMLVTPQYQVMALGVTQENGVYGPKTIRHSAVRDETTWATAATSTSTAREYKLPGPGYLVAGAVCGKNLLVWSNHELWLGTYVGQVSQVWRFDLIGQHCGLIGPNAWAVFGSTAYWISPDNQFHAYTLGGSVQTVACPILSDFADNLEESQRDKIVGTSIAAHGEVWWFYPDSRDGVENSRYISLVVDGPDAGNWSKGMLARTAFCDAGPSESPVGVTYGGSVFWQERGHYADGGVLSWFVTSSDMYLDPARISMVTKMLPDIKDDQQGAVYLTVYGRMFPQGDVTTYGPYTISASLDQLDLRITARLVRMKFSGSSAPSYARLGTPLVTATVLGRR